MLFDCMGLKTLVLSLSFGWFKTVCVKNNDFGFTALHIALDKSIVLAHILFLNCFIEYLITE